MTPVERQKPDYHTRSTHNESLTWQTKLLKTSATHNEYNAAQ